MTHWKLAGSTALVTFWGAAALHADVTPEEVWQNWQKLSATYGQALVADSVVREGDTLVVKAMKISMDQDGAKLNGTLDEVRFRDVGDGTVQVTMSETYPITMTMPGPDGTGTQDLALTISQPGLSMIAGGSATETSYTFDGPSVNIAMQAIEGGKTLADVALTMTNMTGDYLMEQDGEATTLDSNVEVETLAFSIVGEEATTKTNITGTLSNLVIATGGNFLGLAAMENMVQALKDGFTTEGAISYGAGNFAIDVVENGVPTKITASNATGMLDFAMDAAGLSYAAGGTGVAMSISGGEIPFPQLNINYGEASFDLLMPLMKSDTPQNFMFLTKIVDLTVSEEIWAMIDPGASLPRDPATVIINTKGTAKLTTDIMDEETMANSDQAAPGELHSLEITELRAKAAGAELTGTGALTFDNTDLTTFDGVPAPTGKVEMKLVGGNGLLDKLVAMGLVPEDQASGARLMMAMFAKAGAAPDEMTSTLEFKDKGFFANGQRLQ